MMNKKEKIVYAAIEVFQEKGVEKTKISDIVKLAGIAQGTFYLYFPSKLSVMPAIAEVMVEKMILAVKEKVQNDAPFSSKVTQVIDAVFHFIAEYREIQALMYAGLASTEHIKEWEAVYEPLYMWLSEFLNAAKEAGEIRDSVHAERTAKLFIALVESAAEQVYLYDHKDDEQVELQKAEVLDFLTHALHIKK
ncbi:TetR family transcriptional regulator [Bacillus cereus group sp. TH43LC]|jgi:AcrR family transcriptional regulator|uniref:TetR family transcriptional regulator n=1 Tax=Bacillus TaxID=1386 RepID=UPI000789DBB6|nr:MULTISPECIES: TetR family transcriptional regulator [Bacillus]PFT23973.1 TetR/AcrR family transcriptional regulator [Bacillus thuringiensis]KYQ03230.1 Transcriptional regulator TetR family [Bacillus cereus]MBE3640821.1 TetR family transcriptional regulator [Bacillus anthracis]MBE7143033.1 TetR/AcrR family transcriptional regulator [Bacillus paranthracis]MCC2350129.1 TetR family transcriptional regulator [Bacillus pacificus]